jgi:hypothetical protein
MQDIRTTPATAFVDLGYRGVDGAVTSRAKRGDRLHAVLCAAGYNIRWLLRMIARKGITFLGVVFLCLQRAGAQARSWAARIRSTLCTTLANQLTFGAGRLSHA